MKLLALTTLLFTLAVTGTASAKSDAANASKPLEQRKVLSFKEIPELGRDASPCPDAAPVCVADYKSTLVITPQPNRVIKPSPQDAPPKPSPLVRGKQEDLLRALQAFKESMVISRQLSANCPSQTQQRAGAPRTPECDALSKQFNAQRKTLLDSLVSFVRQDPTVFGLEKAPKDIDIIRALGESYSQPRKQGEWIAARIAKLDVESAQRSKSLKDSLEKLRIRLGAFRIRKRDSLRLHLPGYDELQANQLSHEQTDRISFEVPEDKARLLKEESEFNQKMAKRISAIREESSTISEEAKAKSAALLKSVMRIQQSIESGLNQVRGHAREEMLQMIEATKSSATVAAARSSQSIKDDLHKLDLEFTQLQDAINSASSLIDGLDSAAEVGRPDILMTKLLNRVEEFQTVIKTEVPKRISATEGLISHIQDTVKSGASSGVELRSAVDRELVDIAQRRTEELVAIQREVQDIFKDGIQPGIDSIIGFRDRLLGQLERAEPITQLDLSDPAIHIVSGNQAGPTELSLSDAGANAGDTIRVVINISRDGETGPPYEELKTFKIEKFGWSSNIVGGLAFVKSERTSQANFEPTPTMTWLISRKSRPAENKFYQALGLLGFGFHTVTLDFDPNNSVEVGMGASIHFFRDLVQVGYGANLNLKQDRQYFFVGLRIFELLKSR